MRKIIRDLWGIEDGEVRMQDRFEGNYRNSPFSEESSGGGRHRCRIDGSSAACFEIEGELWVKEYADENQREGRTYKVNFCPQCGYRKPPIHYFKSAYEGFPVCDESDETISKFSASLAEAIAQMNYNIAIVKASMSAQSTQNQCFMDKEIELSKDINYLKEEVNYIKKFTGIGEK